MQWEPPAHAPGTMREKRIILIVLAWITSLGLGASQAAAQPESPATEVTSTEVQTAPEPSAPTPAPVADLTPDDEAAIAAALAADLGEAESSGRSGADAASEDDGPSTGFVAAIQSMNPDISFVADVAFAYFGDEDRVAQSGAHDPARNGFTLQQLEAAIGAAVDPYFRLDGNLVFTEFGVEVEEIYATTMGLPAQLQLRAGQFLHRFGRTNATHPHAWAFVDQPFALGRIFGGEGGRGVGLELSWLSPLPWYVEGVVSATNASGGASARSFYGNNDQGFKDPSDLLYVTAIKQFFPLSDDLSLFFGLSAALGPNGTGQGNRTDVFGSDIYFKYRPISGAAPGDFALSFTSEWFVRRRQVPAALLTDVSSLSELELRLNRHFSFAVRHELGTPSKSGDGTRGLSDLEPEWVQTRNRYAAAVTYQPTEYSRVRVQGAYDDLPRADETNYALFIATEFVIGAHGAHAF